MNVQRAIHPPFTSAEFHDMARRGAFGRMRTELRRGVIVKMSPQHYPHASLKSDIQHALERALAAAEVPWKVLTEITVSFGDGFDPLPDVVVFDPDLVPDKTGPIPAAAVKLIVEVSDNSLVDDLGPKREEYAEGGLPEYWVADVKARVLHRCAAPDGSSFRSETSVPLSADLAMLTQPVVVARL